MSLFFATGSTTTELSSADLRAGLEEGLGKLGKRRKVLAIPPDFTRFHSRAGELTEMAWEFYGERLTDVLPALGTHRPMTDAEIGTMFGRTPRALFRVHNWREDVVTLGEVPGEFLREVSEGKLNYPWPAQVNRLLRDGGHDLILSLGQVVPHEVVGMANGAKNVLIGTGGPLGIHRSHFLGAVYGMERMMGRVDTPVRRVLRYASEHFARNLPLVYVQTVMAKNEAGKLVVRGLFVSDDEQAFEMAASLSLECNFQRLPREIRKAVVFLDPQEFRSTWLGNKSVYRTRMALVDGAELIVLAPGVREFGEDPAIDTLIRRYGYCGTPAALAAAESDPELAANLSAAAHLIHGSSEGRFTIRYCPGHLSRKEIEGVHYAYGDLRRYQEQYNPTQLRDGWNTVDGEEIFFVSNPGLGLWRMREDCMSNEAGPLATVLMGVTGCGKTTIGLVLAKQIAATFADADDYHSAANKAKMAAGHPLTDEDRAPWLAALNGLLQSWVAGGQRGVLACSALKESYRETLSSGLAAGQLAFVWLDVPRAVLEARLAARHHEYMNPALLGSQLATLEPPSDALRVVNDRTPEEVAGEIVSKLGLKS